MTTIEQIKAECRAIIALAEKASPAPWHNESDWPRVLTASGKQICQMVDRLSEKTKGDQTPDSHFITASRSITPRAARALLTAIEALEEVASLAKNEFYKFVARDAEKQLETICREWEDSK